MSSRMSSLSSAKNRVIVDAFTTSPDHNLLGPDFNFPCLDVVFHRVGGPEGDENNERVARVRGGIG